MIEKQEHTQKLDSLKLIYFKLLNVNTNLKISTRSYLNKFGLNEFKKYDSNVLEYVYDESYKKAINTFEDPNRAKERSFTTILLHEVNGLLAELKVAMTYGLTYDEFINQIENRIGATPFDLMINGFKIEVKHIHNKYAYSDEPCTAIDTMNMDLKHPITWKRGEKGEKGFDYMILVYNIDGKYEILGEVSWEDYEKSIKYGSGKGEKGAFYYSKIKDDPSLEYKIVLNNQYIYPEGTYSLSK